MDSEVKLCFGIISYLPRDNPEKLSIRLKRINKLVTDIGNYFPNIPIMILGQCWQGVQLDPDKFKNAVTVKNFNNPLGINGARQKLREWFINDMSEYNTMIMLDDDADLRGDKYFAKAYLDTIYKNPGKFGVYKMHLLKLFVMPKEVYKLIEIPDGGADSNKPYMRFFEDQYIQLMLEKFYPELEFHWPAVKDENSDKTLPLNAFFDDVSNSAFDEDGNSGWHARVYSDDSENLWKRFSTGNCGRKFMSTIPNKEALQDKKLLNRLLERAGKFIIRKGGKHLTEYIPIEKF